MNQRLVTLLRQLADCYRRRAAIIAHDRQEAAECLRLNTKANELLAKADAWEQHPA